LAYELRSARHAAGVSQDFIGRAARVSGMQVSRLERAEVPGASIVLFARVFAVLGMRLSVRAYPEGVPIRDAAHAGLLARFKAVLHPMVRLRTEVPLRLDNDRRAWDGELKAGGDTCKVEAETVLSDLQATERRIALKMADDHVDRVILLVADTRRNRRVLSEYRELIAARFPLGTRAVLRELRAGRIPGQSGIVLL